MFKKLKPYIATVLYGIKHITAYKSEMWGMVLFKLVRISLLLFLWGYVLKDANVGYTTKQMISYILVVNGVQVLLGAEYMRGAREIGRDIYQGKINNYLLRPFPASVFSFLLDRGKRGIEVILAFVEVIAGLILAPPQLTALLPFTLSVIIGSTIAFGLNIIVGSFAFWTTEAGGIKNAFSHIVKIFGGTFIPVDLFPELIKKITILTPFPYMAYFPTAILANGVRQNSLEMWIMSAFWAIALLLLSRYIWSKGLKRYEAIGI